MEDHHLALHGDQLPGADFFYGATSMMWALAVLFPIALIRIALWLSGGT